MSKSLKPDAVHSVSLIAWGCDFDPREVTRLLGVRPSRVWRKGERKSYRDRDGVRRYFTSEHEWSGWKKWPTDRQAEASVERQLSRWVARLRPKVGALRSLRRRGISMELDCCIIASRSIRTELPADLVASIGKLGLALQITWHAPLKKRVDERLQPIPRQ